MFTRSLTGLTAELIELTKFSPSICDIKKIQLISQTYWRGARYNGGLQ